MLGNRKLILDTWCEVYDLLKPWADGLFWDLKKHTIVPGAIYLIGRAQISQNRELVRTLIEQNVIRVILSNPAEGSATLKDHCDYIHKCGDLARDQRMLLIGGGDMDPAWPCLQYDNFLPKIFDYSENVSASQLSDQIYDENFQKPYKFLFLNGRQRQHRKYLLEKFALENLLDHALWTNLEDRMHIPDRVTLIHENQNLMLKPLGIKLLPPEYEVGRYRSRLNQHNNSGFIKHQLFKDEWGDAYIEPKAYIDTYFSVVTETVFDYPYSFRTEKIWKPMAMAHPWIAVANTGYYRDMRNLGFQTFGHVIDESFDDIEDSQKRLERISDVVKDLCQQDLASFLKECYSVCKYNQQHLAQMRVQVRQEFPERFFQFVKKYHFDE